MDVGVRELKQRLSEYVERAAKGETVRVTDRGVPKALLGPLPGRPRIEEGIADGWITAGNEKRTVSRVRRARSPRRIADVLSEDRER
jgi:prevent-host-death family protein